MRSNRAIKYENSYKKLVNRIRKTFYLGGTTAVEDLRLTLPLASYASELFSKSHKNYSLNRLSTYNACKIQASPCSLIMAFILLERLNATDPSYVRRITPHELFIVSMMISTKFYIGLDEEIYLSDWASEGNMTEDRLKELELDFLCAIDWNIYISNEEFFKKLSSVEKSLAEREGFVRGWLTYTELQQVMPSFNLTKALLNALFNHIAVMVVTYAAGILTIVGAFFLASQIPGHMLHKGSRSEETTPSSSSVIGDLVAQTQIPISNETYPNTDLNINATISMAAVAAQHNATCNALNVEAELLRLERQYKEEQKAEELLNRIYEMKHVSYALLPADLIGTQSRATLKFTKQENKWFVFKETYSERIHCNSNLGDDKQAKYVGDQVKDKNSKYIYDCFKNFGNCTSNLFWQLLSETAQKSFVHLPLLWFKFM